eukprot:TRINITY_DN7720_c0_g1_i3.p1 TRINITY_DN7720_c0_g1~~TRINITY_DN7720_c0_g1_i3.p1  ORF type:complete len:1069 (+),score=251.26 TRINITY_DN7720_c0_g1_i3:58-3207(+)
MTETADGTIVADVQQDVRHHRRQPVIPHISKKKLRRQAFLEKRKQKEVARAALVDALKHGQIPAEQLQQLKPTRTLGQHVHEKQDARVWDLLDETPAAELPQRTFVWSQPITFGDLASRKPVATAATAAAVEEGADNTAGDTAAVTETEDHRSSALPEVRNRRIWEKPDKVMTEVAVAPQQTTRSHAVLVNRLPDIQRARRDLPIVGEEGTVMDAISSSNVVVLCGETGSGKTTQVPQFLYEQGYGTHFPGAIAVTQPRRVAAISACARVATELNATDGLVGYAVRHSSTVTEHTLIRFMTDGVLLRIARGDMLLRDFSAIVVDEAHERSMDTDVLLGFLSRVVKLRADPPPEYKHLPPLKLIIMSATLRTDDFVQNARLFFPPPPLVTIAGRQHPVTVHFAKETPTDYAAAAFHKVTRIHRELPPGGVLVFMTGREDVVALVKRLRSSFRAPGHFKPAEKSDAPQSKPPTKRHKTDASLAAQAASEADDDTDGILADLDEQEEAPALVDNTLSEATAATMLDIAPAEQEDSPMIVLPLYALLDPREQMRVFQDVPEGTRLVVVATNVAETSLTIPAIRYVVDGGRVKEREWDTRTGVSRMTIQWASQASADQRAGRAGRTGPGHCYRLFTSAAFHNACAPFPAPAITRVPVAGVVLHLKAAGIANVQNFPFPTPPDAEQLSAALKTLEHLQAIDAETGHITPLGRSMAAMPIDPRHARMMVLGAQSGLAPYAIALVAGLSMEDPFLLSHVDEQATQAAKKSFIDASQRIRDMLQHEDSDALTLMRVVGAATNAKDVASFCAQQCLRLQPLKDALALRIQLSTMLNKSHGTTTAPLAPLSVAQEQTLLQTVTAGFCDRVARKVGYGRRPAYRTMWSGEDDVFLHPTCGVHGNPEFVVYRDVVQASAKQYLVCVSKCDPHWLPRLARALCVFGNPLEDPEPRYDAARGCPVAFFGAEFGPGRWPLPPTEAAFPATLSAVACRVFARALLEGQVFQQLAVFKDHLVAGAASVTRGGTTYRVAALVQPLVKAQIKTKAALLAHWYAVVALLI